MLIFQFNSFHVFSFNHDDFYNPPQFGAAFRGPIYSPLRLLYNIIVWSFVSLVPALYAKIFLLRRKYAVCFETIYWARQPIRSSLV